MSLVQQVTTALQDLRQQGKLGSVFGFDINRVNPLAMDFGPDNTTLAAIDPTDTDSFTKYVFEELERNGTEVGVGGYFEDRVVYQSEVFITPGQPPRTIHLGVDVWTHAETPILSPLPGKIHSFGNNDALLDYGPTIIVEYEVDGVKLYALHGHLSEDSLEGLQPGQEIAQGEQIAKIGAPPTNGHWPPHLHYQLMVDMQDMQADYPGVCSREDIPKYQEICPDPNLILNIEALNPYD